MMLQLKLAYSIKIYKFYLFHVKALKFYKQI